MQNLDDISGENKIVCVVLLWKKLYSAETCVHVIYELRKIGSWTLEIKFMFVSFVVGSVL